MNVLVISGGGVYGVIPASVLKYLEHKSGRPIFDSVDLMVGTSTGAILVAGLDHHETAAQLLNDYVSYAHFIFKTSFWKNIKTAHGLLAPIFSQKELQIKLDQKFGNTTIHDFKKPLLIMGYNATRKKVDFFNSWEPNTVYQNTPIYKILLSATAAPGIFPLYQLKLNKKINVMTDGAMISNSPMFAAYIAARILYPNRAIRLINIADGSANSVLMPRLDKLNTLGLMAGLGQAVAVLIHGHALEQMVQLRLLLNIQGSKLAELDRINIGMPTGSASMFDGSKKNIDELIRYSKELIKNQHAKLDHLATLLKKHHSATPHL